MDHRLTGPPPSEVERAAVDGALATGGTGRDQLLPALHALQDRVGFVSEGGLRHVCERLRVPPAEAYGVASFYHLLALAPRPRTVVHVCDDLVCRAHGAEAAVAAVERACAGGPATVARSPCLGLCERAPAALILAAGASPCAEPVGAADARAVADAAARADSAAEAAPSRRARRLAKEKPGARLERVRRAAPQAGTPGLRLLARVGRVDPESVADWKASGGGEGLRKALALGPAGVVREVIASGLVGRGGAAFPAGKKWEAVAAAPAPRHLILNADESEPGTFKDRVLMEEDPFALLEGMTIAAYAAGCGRGYVYVRGEYPLARLRMERAAAAARKEGLLGPDVLGSGFSFEVEVRRGGGAYICGEETALMNSIEGKRGEPRQKPPFPTQAGLFGRPTVINNVETLAAVPWIVRDGGAAWARIGTKGSSGAKLFSVAGHVARPGVYEVEFGATLRQLLALAGGVPAGRSLRAVLLGGAAGSFVGPGDLDLPLTFEGTRAAGVGLGSGAVIVFDDSADLGDLLARVARFFRDESCGQCVPCRVGTVRQEEALARLRAGRPLGGREAEVALVRELGQAMHDASICGLGQTASSALESALSRLGAFSGGTP